MAGEIGVVVCGARGRMGRTVVAAVAAEPDMAVAAEVDLDDDIAAALASGARVMVDFTAPDAALGNARAALAAGVAPIVGTTGMAAGAVDELAAAAAGAGLGGAVIPNFAIGAVLMMRLAEIAGPYFEAVEVVEAHHAQKLDAPSGTALATARRLAAARATPFAYARPEKVTLEGTRGGEEGSVGVHSIRLPGLVADQEIIFGAAGQTMTIAHRTTGREAFMPGVLATIRAVNDTGRFYRALDEVLGLASAAGEG
ncbi:MAG: 4-hydroxy-tetrahydrodipicolinate reductase [Chloroflexota bacterium]|jgi:4-hydroxy-tetrahydrodipicolinate reductase|nr:4-hydroxy-tetrahydrodipicolinate reductase [Chloroflexota bacterium]